MARGHPSSWLFERPQRSPLKITTRRTDYDSADDLRLLCQWYNDPAISPLFNLFQTEAESHHVFTAADFLRRRLPPAQQVSAEDRLILADDVPVGEARFEIDTPKLHTRQSNTGWISLVIGAPECRGRGVGTKVVRLLESELANRGIERIEVSVFEYNEASLKLFRKLGYVDVAQRLGRVWWRGQMWAELRLLKESPL